MFRGNLLVLQSNLLLMTRKVAIVKVENAGEQLRSKFAFLCYGVHIRQVCRCLSFPNIDIVIPMACCNRTILSL